MCRVTNTRRSLTITLPAMTRFSVSDTLSRNRVRPYASAGYSYTLSARSSLGTSLQVATPLYGNTPQINVGVRYAISF